LDQCQTIKQMQLKYVTSTVTPSEKLKLLKLCLPLAISWHVIH